MEYRYRAAEPDHSIWWQVALGVFLALLAHSIITGLYERRELNKAMRQIAAEAEKAEKQAQRQLQATAATAAQHPLYPYTSPIFERTPLRDGERCIQGRRFKRVENGWVQLPKDPC